MTQKNDCEILFNALFSSVEVVLKEHKEFYPVGAFLNNNDEIEFIDSFIDNEFPDSQMVIDSLTLSLKQMAKNNEIKACGIAWNGTISTLGSKGSDAIIVSLEHKNDYSIMVMAPYKIGLFKKIRFSNLISQDGKKDIFL